VNTKGITGSVFYAETINSDKYYVRLTVTEFFAKLAEEKWSYAWFQQGSASAHTAEDFLSALEKLIGEIIINKSYFMAIMFT
jgi:hypothetical protein